MAGINLVVSCSKRKSRPPLPELCLRTLPKGLTPARRAARWLERLRRHEADRIPACDLYAGEHWHVVRSIPALPSQSEQPVKVWVCSAGYGLVSFDTPLAPYSVTFTRGEPDSVVAGGARGGSTVAAAWWSALAVFTPSDAGPRTIADLARRWPGDFLLVALPAAYLDAVAGDVLAAVRVTARAAVLSVGGTPPAALVPHFLTADARLRARTGGTLGSLNARLARLLVERLGRTPLTFARCQRAIAEARTGAAASVPTTRDRLTDTQVESAIRSMLRTTPAASPSRLLRRLRKRGLACEQSRFTTHFRRIREGG